MKLFYLFYICNGIILCFSEGVYFPKKNGIIHLNDYTFEEAFKEYNYFFISVYSEICGFCIHKINPSFEDLYKEIKNNEPELKDIVGLAQIDGSYNNYFMNKYNIIGYPSILLFKNGIIQAELIDKKNVEDMIIFLRKHILKPIQYLTLKNQYIRLTKNSNKESFITYYGNNQEEINSLIEISYNYNYITFTNIKDVNLIHELNATERQLSINKFFDEPRIIESSKKNESWTYYNIDNFIKKYNHRILIEFVTKEGEILLKQRKNILLLINKQELTKGQIKRVQYMEKINIKEEMLNNENKINNKNFFKLAKDVRNIIQSSFVIYRKNMININNKNEDKKRKERKRIILDEEDPFGFEAKKEEIKDCEKRQINFVNKLDLNNEINCEIRLIFFENEKKIKFFKLECGKEKIKENIIFIENWYNKNLSIENISYDLDTNN